LPQTAAARLKNTPPHRLRLRHNFRPYRVLKNYSHTEPQQDNDIRMDAKPDMQEISAQTKTAGKGV
jgi:hypothetical protein